VDKQDLVAKSVGITTGGELAEVHQSLFLGIGGQLVRQSDQNAYGQRRDQSQHKENDLVVYIYSSIYYDLGSEGVLPITLCQMVSRCRVTFRPPSSTNGSLSLPVIILGKSLLNSFDPWRLNGSAVYLFVWGVFSYLTDSWFGEVL